MEKKEWTGWDNGRDHSNVGHLFYTVAEGQIASKNLSQGKEIKAYAWAGPPIGPKGDVSLAIKTSKLGGDHEYTWIELMGSAAGENSVEILQVVTEELGSGFGAVIGWHGKTCARLWSSLLLR